MTAADFFEQKYGNRLSENESWVLRFAEEYAMYIVEQKPIVISSQWETVSPYELNVEITTTNGKN